MYGAFIGDIVGSKYEFNNIKSKQFPLFSADCDYTDDTIITVAVARAILESRKYRYDNADTPSFYDLLISNMQSLGRKYPNPKGAYGGSFVQWLYSDDPQPYFSFGNGAAMRVSPCGLVAVSLEEAQVMAYISAEVSHNHPQGIKGAVATASAIYMAKTGCTKDEIKKYIEEKFYSLDMTVDMLGQTYSFDPSCQGSVPQSIVAFLESTDFEDSIRNVMRIGGDCDTLGAITGSIAYSFYSVAERGTNAWLCDELPGDIRSIKEKACEFLPREFVETADELKEVAVKRAGTLHRMGYCTPIIPEVEYRKYLDKLNAVMN